MNTLRDYVDWKLTHPQGHMSRNLFDKDNVNVNNRYCTMNNTPTDTGVQFYTDSQCTPTTYAQMNFRIGSASDFKGKTLILTIPKINGTKATKISVMNGISSVQDGSNCAKSGDLYYSKITVDDKEYTTEKICIMLYVYGKQPNELIIFDEIMVHEGTEPLPYEPYGKFIKK